MGHQIKEMTYDQVCELINENSVIVLPIGGGSKEHGYHLPMGTDLYVTDYVAAKVTEKADVFTLPTLPYAHFPAFVEWKGSVSIDRNHFTDYVSDILKSFIKFGIRKFLIIDGGVSTHPPLAAMARDLYNEYGARIAVSDIRNLAADVEAEILEQKRGGHGDESETSTMLVIREDLVHMAKAAEEYSSVFPGTVQNGYKKITFSEAMMTPHGINGNATLATKEKGEKVLNCMVDSICAFLDGFISWVPE